MHRSLFAVIIAALAAIATFGGLAFVWAAPRTTKASQRPEGDWRILDPVTYENIAIFPVVSGSSQDTSNFLTLEEGLASGEVIVSERGAAGMVRNRGVVRPTATPQYDASVNQLVLINRSKRPLLLLAGELVSGGKQDRIIGKDRIVPVGAEPLPRRLLRGARALDRQQLAIHRVEDHRPPQRPRASGGGPKANRGVGGSCRWLYCLCQCVRRAGCPGASQPERSGRSDFFRSADAVLPQNL